jgi:hypothetical protein
MEHLLNSNGPSPKSNGDDTLSAILALLQDHYINAPADRAGDPEVTVWDMYYNEARKVDQKLITDWNSQLSSLMIFVRFPCPPVIFYLMDNRLPSSQ